MNISFIGFGNMAKAMAAGLLNHYNLRAASPTLPIGINENGIKTFANNLSVVTDADIIILAVKPALMDTVFEEICETIPKHCLVISIASGISLPWFAKKGPKVAIVRAMPNIAAAIGESATPLIANALVSAEQKQWAEEIFTRIGIITWVKKEADIDAFTALSGSGPAYVFLFMEAMIKAGVDLGIEENIATSFALQTVHGALSLASQSKRGLADLRKSVTSPAGTTAAALEVFSKEGFEEIVCKAMKAACERAEELGLN
jgi:pyrroline-5-carboxylate reductase